MNKPRIGIAANLRTIGSDMPGMYFSYVSHDYVEALERSGAIPVMLPVLKDLDLLRQQMEGLSGILLPGGYDIDPMLYGEQPVIGQDFAMAEVDRFSIRTLQEADAMGLPVLGVCKGIQVINVAFGGTLYQDLPRQKEGCLQHSQKAPRYNPSHYVSIEAGSFLSELFPARIAVNSFHHQAVKETAKGFRVTARAEDGVIEAIEKESGTFMLGVQWHPEMMAKFDDPQMLRLIERFVDQCKKA